MTLAVASAPVPATSADRNPAPLRAFEAQYRVLHDDSPIGVLHARLEAADNGRWHYRFESEATAFLVRLLGIETLEAGWIQWSQGRVVPLTYHHEARRPGRDRFWQHRYDWSAGRIDSRNHTGEIELQTRPGLLDPLSLRLAVVSHMQSGDAVDTDLQLQVLERDEIELQQYRYLREEWIAVDGRCYRTAVWQRFRKPGSSRNYIAWHAPALDYLIVREAHLDDNKPVVLELTDLEAAGISLPPKGECPERAPSE